MLKVVLSGLLSRRWILMWICGLSCALASPALGDLPKCKRGESRDVNLCEGQKRDLRTGCCKVPKSRLKRKRRSKAKPKPKREVCLPGQVKNSKTKNHCCYPGQYWSQRKSKCMGAPECPESLGMVKTSAGCGCPEGQVIDQYTNGHCCWKGQEWVDGEGCMGELSAEQRGLQAKLRARDLWKSLGIKFIKIPGGSFSMGSNSGDSDEKPVHQVRVNAFEMSKTEVTVGQYRKCVEAGRCSEPNTEKEYCNWGKNGRENHPINCVDWGQARTFAKWVGSDVDLPSEAEWEYAARGGQSFKYAGSNDADEVAWYTSNTNDTGTRAVGTKKANGFGLHDMSGNVWEWTLDEWHDSYSGAPSDGSAWGRIPTCRTMCDNGSARRVLRGGGWGSYAGYLRVASRSIFSPAGRYLGFRLRRTLP